MRIVVDPDLCEGNAVCTQLLPDVFELGDDVPVRLLIERIDPARRAELQEAVDHCPRNALRLEED
jgi:ferredoxin